MVKRLTLILAVALIVGLAIPAFAEVQNIKVSGDLTLLGIARNFFETDINKHDARESHAASILRLRIDADLTDKVSTVVRLLNERDWDEETANETEIATDLAYLTLKEFLYSPLTLILGRQELHFGNDFIIGDPDRNNNSAAASTLYDADLSVRKAFDAMRATLDYNPLVIDVFWAKVDENDITGTAALREKDDIDLFGGNVRYDFGGNWNAIGELYYFGKFDRGTTVAEIKKKLNIHNFGTRIEITPQERLMLQGEFAFQFGKNQDTVTYQQVDHQALAAQGIVRYALDAKYDPIVMAIYSFYSGDKNGNDADSSRAWDPMYENQTNGHIANVLLDPSNLHTLGLRGIATPMDDVALTVDWIMYRFARAFYTQGSSVTLWMPDHTATSVLTATGKDDVGQELDVALAYDYTEDVQLGLLAGWFFPGDAFDSKSTKVINEVIASCKVAF